MSPFGGAAPAPAAPPVRVPRPVRSRASRPPLEVERTPDWESLAPPGLYARSRRAFDLVLVLGSLPLVCLLAAPIVLLNLILFRDPRRVLFLRTRVGYRGQHFRIYKFRTMRPAARGVMDSWSSGEDGLRVTGFGRLLRRTHLDELPQFINVLAGDMALVGPRPEMVEVDEWARRHVEGFHERLAVRPGITGLAQITQGYTGRDVQAYRRKLELDRLYLGRLSLFSDCALLLRTALWMGRGRGWRRGRRGAPDRTPLGRLV